MKNAVAPLANERGSVIALAMIMLALLTLIGVVSINMSTTGGQLAASKHYNQVEFYVAESAWKEGALWLDNQAGAPGWVNTQDEAVKNLGRNTAADANTANLKMITPDNSSLSYYKIPYWYAIEHLDSALFSAAGSLAGNEKGYERMFYEITSKANMVKEEVGATSQEIKVRASKVYKVGY
ncbi:MAG: pilus assembly PilX N-terminal domain-containing protein [Desulfobacterales bacterium]|jgi:Tfp pilus assembly protein PilX|nr:pilus assembly PilX N-terminal domain-containing protein [Desulfobacterales bacterium]